MRLITIENRGWGSLVIHEGKLRGARLEWRVWNDLEIYIKGPATDCYDLMCVTAITEAHKMGFMAGDVRRQSGERVNRPFTTETRKLI